MIPQHSLPGGRYPLPGPDFHRLDRASFAWRTQTNSKLFWRNEPQEIRRFQGCLFKSVQLGQLIVSFCPFYGVTPYWKRPVGTAADEWGVKRLDL